MGTEFDFIKKMYKKIPSQTKICFVTAIVTGFLTHLYMLTHKLPNWDDINCFSNAGATSSAGRWMLEYLKKIPTNWSNPWINGSIAIFLIAISCCLVLSILELKSMTSAVLVPVLFMTFPSVASTMTFMFTVDMYMLGLVFAVLAVYLTKKYKYGFVGAGILLIGSLGIYQAYICFAITLFIFWIFQEALQKKGKKIIWTAIGKAVGVLAVSVVVYIFITKLLCPNMADYNYAGTAEMGQISLTKLPILIARSYKRILEYFILKPFSYISTAGWIVNILVCLLLVVCFVWLMVAKKMWKDKNAFVICVLTMLASPLGIAFIYVMSPEAAYSTLMMYQYVLVYILLLVFMENLWKESIQAIGKKIIGMVTVVLLLLTAGFHYTVTGEAYFRMDLSMTRVTEYYNRLLTRLELEGYESGEPFLIMGHSQAGDDKLLPPEHYSLEDEKFEDFSGISPEYGILSSVVRENFLRVYFGMDVPWLSDAEKEEILESEEFEQMSVYPKEGCVQKINDVWIIKISEGQ